MERKRNFYFTAIALLLLFIIIGFWGFIFNPPGLAFSQTIELYLYKRCFGVGTSCELILTGNLDVTGDTALKGTTQIYFQETLAKTDNYTIATSDFGTAITMNSTVSKTFTLPSVSASENGALIGPLQKIGAGAMIVDAADSDYIDDSGVGNTIYNDEGAGPPYPSISLMYNHGTTTWIVVDRIGTFVTTD